MVSGEARAEEWKSRMGGNRREIEIKSFGRRIEGGLEKWEELGDCRRVDDGKVKIEETDGTKGTAGTEGTGLTTDFTDYTD